MKPYSTSYKHKLTAYPPGEHQLTSGC